MVYDNGIKIDVFNALYKVFYATDAILKMVLRQIIDGGIGVK